MSSGSVLKLRRKENTSIAVLSAEMNRGFDHMKQVHAVGEYKRMILIYRMLEADMAGLSRAQLEQKVSRDWRRCWSPSSAKKGRSRAVPLAYTAAMITAARHEF